MLAVTTVLENDTGKQNLCLALKTMTKMQVDFFI